MVAIAHSFIAITFSGVDKIWETPIWSIEPTDAIIAKLILFVANGQAAVSIFFVLSGIVLGLSLDHDQSGVIRRYLKFLTKRIFRIYPAHIFTLLIICTTIIAFSAVNPGTFAYSSTWYNWYYRSLPDSTGIIRNLFLIDVFLNPVTWTLKVEMGVAVIFPVLHFISRTRNNAAIWMHLSILTVLILLAIIYSDGVFIPHVYKFYLGLLLPLYLPKISHLEHWAFWPASFTLLLLLPQFLSSNDLNGILITAGAVVLISLLMKNQNSWLSHNHIIKKLGQYSYSFYLFHFPVLWFTYFLLNQNQLWTTLIKSNPFAVASMVCLFSILIAYAISSATYWLIEKRFILIGRRLAGSL